jgi:hypothetical protein
VCGFQISVACRLTPIGNCRSIVDQDIKPPEDRFNRGSQVLNGFFMRAAFVPWAWTS